MMDTIQMTFDFLLNMPFIQEWYEMQVVLKHAVSKKPRDWQLPVLACGAVGGTQEQAIPAAAAIACLQISIILIDDMLDSDPRGMYRRIGAPAAANLAAGFQAAGLKAISQSEARSPVRFAALNTLNQMMLTTALGQHWDAQNPVDEATYWRIVRTKSSPFFSSALQVGALLGGASNKTLEQIKWFGNLYGEMIQIHDDLNDTMAVPPNPDWILGRSPLPILYAQVVDHPDKERFLELRQTITDPEIMIEAQSILIRCGAVSYCLDQLLRRLQAMQKALAAMSLIYQDGFEDLLEDVYNPAKKLFMAIGVKHPEALLPSPIPVP